VYWLHSSITTIRLYSSKAYRLPIIATSTTSPILYAHPLPRATTYDLDHPAICVLCADCLVCVVVIASALVPRERLFRLTPAVLPLVAPRLPSIQPSSILPDPASCPWNTRRQSYLQPKHLAARPLAVPTLISSTRIVANRCVRRGIYYNHHGPNRAATTPGYTVTVSHRITALSASTTIQCRARRAHSQPRVLISDARTRRSSLRVDASEFTPNVDAGVSGWSSRVYAAPQAEVHQRSTRFLLQSCRRLETKHRDFASTVAINSAVTDHTYETNPRPQTGRKRVHWRRCSTGRYGIDEQQSYQGR
jgi:hypothetical protein